MSQHSRGSSHQLLRWIHKERDAFVRDLINLINIPEVKITANDWWRPDCTIDGGLYPEEVTTEGISDNIGILPEDYKKKIKEWWLKHHKGANTPNWDFISSANIEGTKGLLIIEAKSHKNEIHKDGKILKDGSSKNSKENHIRIFKAIEEAKNGLSKNYNLYNFNLSIGNYYQLSNRIAYAWKFATLGIPIILIYLGFIKDIEMSDAGEPFDSPEDWNEFIKRHIKDIFPVELLERKINCGKGFFYFLVRSKEIENISQREVF